MCIYVNFEDAKRAAFHAMYEVTSQLLIKMDTLAGKKSLVSCKPQFDPCIINKGEIGKISQSEVMYLLITVKVIRQNILYVRLRSLQLITLIRYELSPP